MLGLCLTPGCGWANGRRMWRRPFRGHRCHNQAQNQNVSLLEIVSAGLAFFGAYALISLVRGRRDLKRMVGIRANIIKKQAEEIAEAGQEKERAMRAADLLDEQIEGASMAELADIINATFDGEDT